VVVVQDAGGNTVTTDTSNVTLAITSGTGTAGAGLICTANPKAAASGVATFAGCKIDRAGSGYTLTATDGSLNSAVSSSFDIAGVTQTLLATATDAVSGTNTSSTGSITTTNGATILILVYHQSTQNNETISGITGPFTAATQVASNQEF